MDLVAYAQIELIEQIMKDNRIEVPRLRGLRLMKDEEPFSKEEIKDIAKKEGYSRCAWLCRACPPFDWNTCVSELSDRTDFLTEYYCVCEPYENISECIDHLTPIDIRWDRVHGKKRKAFKYVIKRAKRDVQKQLDMWNKYCGRDDVLYIHCRLGGDNRNYYKVSEIIESQPWFLEDVDDYFDNTYMDIYAKIKEILK